MVDFDHPSLRVVITNLAAKNFRLIAFAPFLQGALDAGTAPRLDEQFAELSHRGITQFDLDIARLEFMDSTGLSVVVAEHKRTKAEGGGLVIHHPSRRVIRLFQTHGLMSYLVVQPRMSI